MLSVTDVRARASKLASATSAAASSGSPQINCSASLLAAAQSKLVGKVCATGACNSGGVRSTYVLSKAAKGAVSSTASSDARSSVVAGPAGMLVTAFDVSGAEGEGVITDTSSWFGITGAADYPALANTTSIIKASKAAIEHHKKKTASPLAFGGDGLARSWPSSAFADAMTAAGIDEFEGECSSGDEDSILETIEFKPANPFLISGRFISVNRQENHLTSILAS